VKESALVNLPDIKPPVLGLLTLLALLVAPPACKDQEPCDPGQESIGTGCFVVATGGSGGGTSTDDGGAPSGGATDEPAIGNPDATFATPCHANAECGGDAPVCATEPLFYCTQLDCLDGEENAGACPDGWTCVHLPPKPSACVNLATAP
jgi:hypothetical protein